MIAQATKTAIAVLVARKFETLGSNFSHETECTDPKKLDRKSNIWRSVFLWLNMTLNLRRKLLKHTFEVKVVIKL